MKLLKINIGNCILGCCQNNKWNYNENELINIFNKELIKRVIIFTGNITNDFNNIEKIINLVKKYNLNLNIRTIFFDIDIEILKKFFNMYDKLELELIFNEQTSFFEEQYNLRKIFVKELIDNNIKFDLINIINSDNEFYINKVLKNCNTHFLVKNRFLLFSNLNKDKIIEISNSNNYNITCHKDILEDKIELNFMNCETINSSKNFYTLKKW